MNNILGSNYYMPQQNLNGQYYNATALPSYQYQNQNYQPYSNQSNIGIIWVQGEQQAKQYQVNPGVVVPLFDSESQTIYIKFLDQQGKPQMTILDYVDRNAPEQKEDEVKVEYATKEQMTLMSDQLEALNKQIAGFKDFVTKDQFESLNGQLDNLSGQIDDIENRLLVFSKPQNTNNNNKRGGGK